MLSELVLKSRTNMRLQRCLRHSKDRVAGHPEDSKRGEFVEGRRGWKPRACLIHASGTSGGRFNVNRRALEVERRQGRRQ